MLLERRHILRASGAIVLGSAVAGCLGDETDDSENGTGEEPDELGIRHLRLVSEQPTDYREYEEVENRRYPPDSVVWFYLEPVGVTTEDAGAGQERIELTGSLTVSDPNGEEVASVDREFYRDIPEGGTDELYLFFQFTPPVTPPVPGEYTAELSVSDDLAGEQATETGTFTIERTDDGPSIEHIRFVEDQPTGYRQYTALDEPVYGADDVIWLYCEPTGLTVETRDGEQWVEFNASMTATGPDGDDVGRTSNEFEMRIPEEEDIEELFVFFNLELRRPELGEHTVEVTIRDQVHRGTVTETTSFTIEDEDLSLVEIFEEVVTDELDIDIERLTFRNDTLTLDYRSTHSYEDDEEEFDIEVAYISGAYAGVIDSGLSAEMFRGLVEDADGTELSYRIETETVRKHNEGELSDSEFLDAVFNTLRVQD